MSIKKENFVVYNTKKRKIIVTSIILTINGSVFLNYNYFCRTFVLLSRNYFSYSMTHWFLFLWTWLSYYYHINSMAQLFLFFGTNSRTIVKLKARHILFHFENLYILVDKEWERGIGRGIVVEWLEEWKWGPKGHAKTKASGCASCAWGVRGVREMPWHQVEV